MSWRVMVRRKSREDSTAAAMGGIGQQYVDDRISIRELSCGLSESQAQTIAKFLNTDFLYIDYATAERE